MSSSPPAPAATEPGWVGAAPSLRPQLQRSPLTGPASGPGGSASGSRKVSPPGGLPQCPEPSGCSWPCCSAEASGAARRGARSLSSSSTGGSRPRISKEVQSRHRLPGTRSAGARGPSPLPSARACCRGTAFLLCLGERALGARGSKFDATSLLAPRVHPPSACLPPSKGNAALSSSLRFWVDLIS